MWNVEKWVQVLLQAQNYSLSLDKPLAFAGPHSLLFSAGMELAVSVFFKLCFVEFWGFYPVSQKGETEDGMSKPTLASPPSSCTFIRLT